MYLAYAQPGMNPPHLQTRTSYTHTPSQSYSSYEHRSTSQDIATGWESTQPSSRSIPQIPEVASWSPKSGDQGTKILIHLRSTYNVDLTRTKLTVKFGSSGTSPIYGIARQPADGTHYRWTIHAEAPARHTTSWPTLDVPIALVASDQSGHIIASLKLDQPFIYSTSSALQASPSMPRKRRLSDSGSVPNDFTAKRIATMPARAYGYSQQNGSYLQASPHMAMSTTMPAYHRPMSHPGDVHAASPTHLHQQVTSMPASQVSNTPSQARSWSSANLGGLLSRSPNMSGSMGRMNTTASGSTMTNPRLVRTSQITQSPSPAATPSVAPHAVNFNPYAMYPHKAQLKIEGDLDSMTENWTSAECDIKRRLVQFFRSQTGSQITTQFQPVAPGDRQPNAICISCIWWEAKNAYYVTSVDTIFLLESLVAVRFTVEEKNRIRRNLEGFRPMTVSKGKADSEDFFKLIMGFPNPKPRNIEKDVKVYPWKILTLALKKIIGKYVSPKVRLFDILLTITLVCQLRLNSCCHASEHEFLSLGA